LSLIFWSRRVLPDDDQSFLDAVASLLGEAVYGCYMHTEHALQHCRLAAVSSIEKEFFRNVSRQSIVDSIVEVVRTALPCDRVTVSMRNDDDTSATIVAAWGDGADALMKTRFDLGAKSLASVVYTNNMLLSRSFSQTGTKCVTLTESRTTIHWARLLPPRLAWTGVGVSFWLNRANTDAYDEDSRELTGRLCTSAGLAIEKMIVFEKANALATHDGLTGLFNHRTFQQLLADEITRAIRYNEPVSLIICDIDFFKKVNDTYGHPFGDVVLRGVAALLENSVRQDIDTVARYGGGRVRAYPCETDSKGACETAERIRSAIERQSFSARSGVEVRVSMSFGIAEYRKHARQINELIGKADKALYRAKENGRNRVEHY
jgi:diguanylate cyclase (GGDEF)-like protein